jgi:hypothetical protein
MESTAPPELSRRAPAADAVRLDGVPDLDAAPPTRTATAEPAPRPLRERLRLARKDSVAKRVRAAQTYIFGVPNVGVGAVRGALVCEAELTPEPLWSALPCAAPVWINPNAVLLVLIGVLCGCVWLGAIRAAVNPFDSDSGAIALAAAWAVLLPTLILSCDSLLLRLVWQNFETYYFFFNTLVFALCSAWSAAERAPDTALHSIAFFASWAAAIVVFLSWDALLLPAIKRPRWRVAIPVVALAACVRFLQVERSTDELYSQQRVCLFYCARLRAYALAGLANVVVFLFKFTLKMLLRPHGAVLARLPFHRELQPGNLQRLVTVLPPGVVNQTVSSLKEPIVETDGRATLELMVVPRNYVLRSRTIVRIMRTPLYSLFSVSLLVAFSVCDHLLLTKEPAVAVVICMCYIFVNACELIKVDRQLLSMLLWLFEPYFVLLNGLVYVATAVPARLSSADGPDNAWSACTEAFVRLLAIIWLTLQDSTTTPRWARIVIYVLFIAEAGRVLLSESLIPRMRHDDASTVCTFICTSLGQVAVGCVVNATLFFIKQMVYLLMDRSAIINITPLLARADAVKINRFYSNPPQPLSPNSPRAQPPVFNLAMVSQVSLPSVSTTSQFLLDSPPHMEMTISAQPTMSMQSSSPTGPEAIVVVDLPAGGGSRGAAPESDLQR